MIVEINGQDPAGQLIPIWATNSKIIRFSGVVGNVTITLSQGASELKQITLTPFNGVAEIDLSVFSPLLAVCDPRGAYPTQTVRYSDSADGDTFDVINADVDNIGDMTDQPITTAINNRPELYYLGKSGSVVTANFNYILPVYNYVSDRNFSMYVHGTDDQWYNVFNESKLVSDINANGGIWIGAHFDVEKLPGNYELQDAYATLYLKKKDGSDAIATVKIKDNYKGFARAYAPITGEVVSVSLRICAIRNMVGRISDPIISIQEPFGWNPCADVLVKSQAYTYGAGQKITPDYENVDVVIDGITQHVRADDMTGIAVRWLNSAGGFDTYRFDDYMFQPKFSAAKDGNYISNRVMEINASYTEAEVPAINQLINSTIIEVYNERMAEWVKATCNNTSGAIWSGKNTTRSIKLTLTFEAWN